VQHSEPALLVGDTGTGKTTVCQMLTLMRGQKLHIINCNQHTETSDFLGGFRPVRSVCTFVLHGSGAELFTYICCNRMVLTYWTALPTSPPCVVASMHAGSVGASVRTGICKHVSPTAMTFIRDWPIVLGIPQWLPAYVTFLPRLRPFPVQGGWALVCLTNRSRPMQ